MRWWNELKYLVRKLNRRRAERELEGEILTGGRFLKARSRYIKIS